MRAPWILPLLVGACGDNVHPPQLDTTAKLPAGTADLAFERDGTAVVRTSDGTVRRRADGRWREVELAGAQAIDVGTDNDGGLLVMSSVPRRLYRIDGGAASAIGDLVIANYVHEPVQVPSGNHYVREVEGAQRSFVLSAGTSTWAESPPMFFSRPVRARDGTLYAMTAAGVQRFEATGARTIAVPCARLERSTCTEMLFGGVDGTRVVVAGDGDVYVVGDGVTHVPLPQNIVAERVVVGDGMTVVLGKRELRYFLYAVSGDEVVEIESADDPPSDATRLGVDADGVVWVATTSLSKVTVP